MTFTGLQGGLNFFYLAQSSRFKKLKGSEKDGFLYRQEVPSSYQGISTV